MMGLVFAFKREFCPEQRANADFPRRFDKRHRAVDRVVIGEGERGQAQNARLGDEILR